MVDELMNPPSVIEICFKDKPKVFTNLVDAPKL